MLQAMRGVFGGHLRAGCLLAAAFLPATATPAHAHGPDPGIVVIVLGSLVIQVVAIPAVILLAGIFKGRRMHFFVPYILFLAVWYFAVLDRLPVEPFIFPIVIVPVLVLVILYAVAWVSRDQGGGKTQVDDLDGPSDRQA